MTPSGIEPATFQLVAQWKLNKVDIVICEPGSSVGTVIGYGLDGPGIEFWWG
jgi:hypothetical protein